ncbi:hypothetical protein Leryth_011463 [Lithospermum erythrorhizon]|nr:hypothetical protein Leryth_011463 [Lithospermum erythrorhizon]
MSGSCNKILHIVKLRQLLKRWRKKSTLTTRRVPSDVAPGHVAVSVGPSCKRFVIRATYLNHPLFKKLLLKTEEEFGFSNSGPLTIPCDENVFEEILCFMARNKNSARFVTYEDFQRYCHVGIRSNIEFWAESRPLLNGVSDKAMW